LLRAGTGAGQLAFAAYLLATPVPGGLFTRDEIHIGVAVLLVWGGFWLCLGIARSRGRRDMLSLAKALCFELLPGVAGLWWSFYVPADWGWPPLVNYGLKGCWIYLLAYGLTVILLSMRGEDGNAQRAILHQIARRNAAPVAARRRRRIFF
jgi:hypothetical protein